MYYLFCIGYFTLINFMKILSEMAAFTKVPDVCFYHFRIFKVFKMECYLQIDLRNEFAIFNLNKYSYNFNGIR